MHTIRVWDLPTRLFHWALVLCFAGLIVSGEVGGDAMVWHFRLGYAVLTLVLFRVVWGLVGGYWSRFRNFLTSPATLWAYVRGQPARHTVGHNPLGALSVLGLLLALLVQVGSGLLSDDEILATGPLVGKVASQWVELATYFHTEIGKVFVIALVCLHVAAIAWYRWKKNKNLLRPMLIGDAPAPAGTPASQDTAATRLLAVGVLLLAGAVVVALLWWAA